MLDILLHAGYISGMETQNKIKQTLTDPGAIDYIKNILAINTDINRTTLAETLCNRFYFFDFRGKHQIGGCIKALRKLEQAGHFRLPESVTGKSPRKLSPRRLEQPVPMPQQTPKRAGDIRDLSLIIVQTEEEMRI